MARSRWVLTNPVRSDGAGCYASAALWSVFSKITTRRPFLLQAPPPKWREQRARRSPDAWPRTSPRGRKKKGPSATGRRRVRPPGVPGGSPQVDGEGRGENDAQ